MPASKSHSNYITTLHNTTNSLTFQWFWWRITLIVSHTWMLIPMQMNVCRFILSRRFFPPRIMNRRWCGLITSQRILLLPCSSFMPIIQFSINRFIIFILSSARRSNTLVCFTLNRRKLDPLGFIIVFICL